MIAQRPPELRSAMPSDAPACALPRAQMPGRDALAAVRLWSLDLARAPADDPTPLSQDEIARMAAIRDPRSRAVFAMTRRALRRILAQMLDCAPAEVRLTTGWNGKPALAPRPGRAVPFFSVSHSGDHALIATSLSGELGVDLEAETPRRNGLRIAARFFAPAEVEALHALPEDRQGDAFTRLWTLKEAVIKATGEGLARRLDSFAIDLAACRLRPEPASAPPGPWHLAQLPAPPGYRAALALRVSTVPEAELRRATATCN